MTARMPASARSRPNVVIKPPRAWSALNLRELWQGRELIYFIGWRDIKVRYTQAALGVGWAVLQPLLLVAVFSVVLGRLAKVPSAGVPYFIFAFAGLVVWTYFANAVGVASESLVASSSLITKVYFPRLVIPIGSLLGWIPDLVIASVLLLAVMLIRGLTPAWTTIFLPLCAAMAFMAALGPSLWLSALNVKYRDVRYAVPFLLQVGLFATPVVYPPTLVPERFRAFLGLNPMGGVVEAFRCSVLGIAPDWSIIGASTTVIGALAVSGLFYFRRMEHSFADVI